MDKNQLGDLLKKAKTLGATAADILMVNSAQMSVRQRMGEAETVERAESVGLGLRVLVKGRGGMRQAMVSSNDIRPDTLNALVDRAVDMAKIAPVDPYTSLAPRSKLAKEIRQLDLSDPNTPTVEQLLEMAKTAEDAALAVKGITNSEAADTQFSRNRIQLLTSDDFVGEYETTSYSLSVSIISGKGEAMENDYDYAVARHLADLTDPAKIGKSAAKRAVGKLKPRKVPTCQVPVIFEARVARSLLSSFAGAINGASVARGATFLKDKMGEQLFPKGIEILDDPFRLRGIASHPFDGEGVAGKRLRVVKDGMLSSWLLDTRSAKQLKLRTTGHAARGIGSPPSPSNSNFYMKKGKQTLKSLIGEIQNGFYVTDAFGMGINGITGDYSQGAGGFWIENGKLTYAVSEVTIAGNMLDMFKNLTAASDLQFLYGTNCPSLRIDGMTIAGT
jgi:PmbA protein